MRDTELFDGEQQLRSNPGRVLPGSFGLRVRDGYRISFHGSTCICEEHMQRAHRGANPQYVECRLKGFMQNHTQRVAAFGWHNRQIHERYQDIRQPCQGESLVAPDLEMIGLPTHCGKLDPAQFPAKSETSRIHGFQIRPCCVIAQGRAQTFPLFQIPIGGHQVGIALVWRRGQGTPTPVRMIEARCHMRGMNAIRRKRGAALRAKRQNAPAPIVRPFQGDKFCGRHESFCSRVNRFLGHETSPQSQPGEVYTR